MQRRPARRTTRHARAGFTLIEVLLVMGILVLLASLVVPQFIGRQREAQRDTAHLNISTFEGLLDQYFLDNGTYPTTEQGLRALQVAPTTEPLPRRWVGYLDANESLLDPWDRPYQYAFPSQHGMSRPDIWSLGPDGQDQQGAGDDVANWTTEASTTR